MLLGNGLSEITLAGKRPTAVVDLDFGDFDIDDNCYVYEVIRGKP
jgi:hypothetical protein